MCSCHSICVMFSGVKLSMGSFVLFIGSPSSPPPHAAILNSSLRMSFYHLMLVLMGVMHETDIDLLDLQQLILLLADSHTNVYQYYQFYCTFLIYWTCHFHLCSISHGVEFGDQILLSSEVLSFFLGSC